jgi:hypothetical protein
VWVWGASGGGAAAAVAVAAAAGWWLEGRMRMGPLPAGACWGGLGGLLPEASPGWWRLQRRRRGPRCSVGPPTPLLLPLPLLLPERRRRQRQQAGGGGQRLRRSWGACGRGARAPAGAHLDGVHPVHARCLENGVVRLARGVHDACGGTGLRWWRGGWALGGAPPQLMLRAAARGLGAAADRPLRASQGGRPPSGRFSRPVRMPCRLPSVPQLVM